MTVDELVAERERLRAALAAATAKAEALERGLASSRRIGMALGIVMERHRLTADQAFDRLRDLSQRQDIKVRDLAEQIIYTGDTERGVPVPTPSAGSVQQQAEVPAGHVEDTSEWERRGSSLRHR